jgi:hypothetical protein
MGRTSCVLACALLAPALAAPVSAQAPLVLETEVARVPPGTEDAQPYCGVLWVRLVAEHRVTRVVSGRYRAPSIYVAWSCPRNVLPETGVRAGGRFRLTLTRETDRAAYPNPFDASAPVYRIERVIEIRGNGTERERALMR